MATTAPSTESTRDAIARVLVSYYNELSPLPTENRFSVSRLLANIGAPPLGGAKLYEQEACEANAMRVDAPYIPYRPIVPWRAFARAMDVHPGSAGGYALDLGPRGELAMLLQPFSIAAESGARVVDVPAMTGDFQVPVEKTAPSGTWLGAGGSASSGEGTLGALALTPHPFITLIAYAKQLNQQAAALTDTFISTDLMAGAGAALDQAVFTGTGGGQPIGLVNRADITPTSGTSITFATLVGMKKAVMLGGAREARLRWIGAPDVQETLAKREKASGSGFIWADGKIADVAAVASARVPAGYLVLADWSTLTMAFWGGGLQISVDPSAGFNTGELQARVLMQADCAFTLPGAVAYAASVT